MQFSKLVCKYVGMEIAKFRLNTLIGGYFLLAVTELGQAQPQLVLIIINIFHHSLITFFETPFIINKPINLSKMIQPCLKSVRHSFCLNLPK